MGSQAQSVSFWSSLYFVEAAIALHFDQSEYFLNFAFLARTGHFP